MADFTTAKILDLVNLTLAQFPKYKFQQLAQEYTEYLAMQFYRENAEIIGGGKTIERNLMYTHPDNVRHVGPFAKDVFNFIDMMAKIEIPWVNFTTNYIFDKKEINANAGEAMVINILKPRRIGMQLDVAKNMEINLWNSPSADTTLLPFGIPFWIVKNATEGFNGGLPTGYTNIGGIDPDVITHFKNWTASYSAISKADLLDKMETAFMSCGFKSPSEIENADYAKSAYQNYRYYTNMTVYKALKAIAEAEQTNTSADLTLRDHVLHYKGYRIVYVPRLDADTTNPLYQMDRSVFFALVRREMDMVESEASVMPEHHNSFAVYLDHEYQYMCVDRRRQAVFYQA